MKHSEWNGFIAKDLNSKTLKAVEIGSVTFSLLLNALAAGQKILDKSLAHAGSLSQGAQLLPL